MKSIVRLILPLLLALLVVATVSAIVIKDPPTAQSNGSEVTIRWITSDETGVMRFEILRRAGTEGDFLVIGSVAQLKGNNSTYEFIDKTAFKTEGGFYQYKIRIINGQDPAPETGVTGVRHVTSAAKSTWGSIKAMFR